MSKAFRPQKGKLGTTLKVVIDFALRLSIVLIYAFCLRIKIRKCPTNGLSSRRVHYRKSVEMQREW